MSKYIGNSRSLYHSRGVSVFQRSDFEAAMEICARAYVREINCTRSMVNQSLYPVYYKNIPFSERIISDVHQKIKHITRVTGKDMGSIASTIRSYVGQDLQFFKKDMNREVPIGADAILAAYEAVKSKKSANEVRSILYF